VVAAAACSRSMLQSVTCRRIGVASPSADRLRSGWRHAVGDGQA
jgi:hypothetical protein